MTDGSENGNGEGGAPQGGQGQGDSGQQDEQNQNQGQQNQNEEPKTYTSDDIERIVQGRLRKFGDYDAIKQQRDELLAATATDSEKAVAAARAEAAAEVEAKYKSMLVTSEAKVMAAGLEFHDPSDAINHLSIDDVTGDDGTVDQKALKAALDDLVKRKPYLVKQSRGNFRDLESGRSGDNSGGSNNISDLLRAAVRG